MCADAIVHMKCSRWRHCSLLTQFASDILFIFQGNTNPCIILIAFEHVREKFGDCFRFERRDCGMPPTTIPVLMDREDPRNIRRKSAKFFSQGISVITLLNFGISSFCIFLFCIYAFCIFMVQLFMILYYDLFAFGKMI